MNLKLNNKFPENFSSKILDISAVTTVISFILFSLIKRFITNENFYYIPLFLFIVNFFILIEIIYMVKSNRLQSSKKEFKNLIFQSILNICFAVFVLLYLFKI